MKTSRSSNDVSPQSRTGDGRDGILRHLFTVSRPHQWSKNLFVLAPLLFSRNLGDPGALTNACIAFACFCLASSAIYVVNDIQDAKADRLHPLKRMRPIAAGYLSPGMAWAWAILLTAGSLALAQSLGMQVLALCGTYLILMLGYCFHLKRVVILDAILIAGGFVIRVAGGAAAISVAPSHWLIICAFLLALYLAFAKRRQEMLTLSDATGHRAALGAYTLPFLEQVNTILLAALLLSYALYTVAPETIARCGTDLLVYGTLFVLYGLLRYLHLIQTAGNGGDPGKLLVSDKPLAATVAGWTVYNAAVIYRTEVMLFWERLL